MQSSDCTPNYLVFTRSAPPHLLRNRHAYSQILNLMDTRRRRTPFSVRNRCGRMDIPSTLQIRAPAINLRTCRVLVEVAPRRIAMAAGTFWRFSLSGISRIGVSRLFYLPLGWVLAPPSARRSNAFLYSAAYFCISTTFSGGADLAVSSACFFNSASITAICVLVWSH